MNFSAHKESLLSSQISPSRSLARLPFTARANTHTSMRIFSISRLLLLLLATLHRFRQPSPSCQAKFVTEFGWNPSFYPDLHLVHLVLHWDETIVAGNTQPPTIRIPISITSQLLQLNNLPKQAPSLSIVPRKHTVTGNAVVPTNRNPNRAYRIAASTVSWRRCMELVSKSVFISMGGEKPGFKIKIQNSKTYVSSKTLAPISFSFSLAATASPPPTESNGTTSDGSPATQSRHWWMSKFLLTQLQHAMVVAGCIPLAMRLPILDDNGNNGHGFYPWPWHAFDRRTTLALVTLRHGSVAKVVLKLGLDDDDARGNPSSRFVSL
ncbi:hypothetical protein R6Q59_007011 [Mikania micrantha]